MPTDNNPEPPTPAPDPYKLGFFFNKWQKFIHEFVVSFK